jgi:hypothetical protein
VPAQMLVVERKQGPLGALRDLAAAESDRRAEASRARSGAAGFCLVVEADTNETLNTVEA